jgi:HSP20 family protein
MTLTNFASYDVDRFLDDAVRAMRGQSVWAPACNAYEDEHGFWLQAALPGMDRKDIEISVEDGMLQIKGERKDEPADAARTYFVREIGWGAFSRTFRLPSNVDPNKVGATYRDGVLTVELPKREEAKPRRIAIESVESIRAITVTAGADAPAVLLSDRDRSAVDVRIRPLGAVLVHLPLGCRHFHRMALDRDELGLRHVDLVRLR